MWFLALILFVDGKSVDAPSLASLHYPTEAACLKSAAIRVQGMRDIGGHAVYLCMYHGEPDSELRRAPKVRF